MAVVLEVGIAETDDHPRRTADRYAVDHPPGGELEDGVRWRAYPARPDLTAAHQSACRGELHIGVDNLELLEAAVGEGEERGCAKRGKELCRLRAGAAETEPAPQVARKPARAIRPLGAKLATDPE